jgi:hypothetical protein
MDDCDDGWLVIPGYLMQNGEFLKDFFLGSRLAISTKRASWSEKLQKIGKNW